ncbi:MAG: ATP-binding protein [Pseudomonadota bacterium]
MSGHRTTLFLVCGKIAAGKSTLAQKLAATPSTVLLSEDSWLSSLYPGEITTLEDYLQRSARLKQVIGPHVVAVLSEGLSVVMDFPANTLRQRKWLLDLGEASNVDHELHFVDVPDDVCKRRLQERNKSGEHPFQTDEKAFDMISRHFEPPTDAEGLNLIVHQT